MNLVRGYALWLKPKGTVYQEIQELISQFQASVGQPVFSPHVTLISGLNLRKDEILNRAKILADHHSAMHVEIERAVWGYTFFQRHYLTLKSTDPLVVLYKAALQMFGETNPGKYRPHISLEYADHTQFPEESIQKKVRSLYGTPVELAELQVVNTNGAFSKWEIEETYPLQKAKA